MKIGGFAVTILCHFRHSASYKPFEQTDGIIRDEARGRVLTHDQLLQRVWGYDHSGETNLTRNMVRSLRRKLDDDARNPKYIFTETGIGYRMAAP